MRAASRVDPEFLQKIPLALFVGVNLRIFNRMRNRTILGNGFCLSLALLFWSLAFAIQSEPSCAQSKKPSLKSAFGDKGFGSLGGIGSFGGSSGQPYTLEAAYSAEKEGLRGRVQVTVSLKDDFTIYSITQPKGGPLRTTIEVKTAGVELEGPFTPDKPPKASSNELGWPRRHHGSPD